ncbi:hypothetical protein GCM10010193_51780 [Kitasatospora atroaurantiaca]|uniref:Uncharacterized protein DUF1353 n=1 Tax=Kitasatospora atroaurantiaca TaxID=285545 RepID=A0A561EXV7_9ACTN|nr:DUF1353 domain-containing protein [Kitasatospora atroaurantiaca]TWE20446.1 uncharacterized protein DUF1353 [Kitasatospora atroaurantiaca]
MPFVDGDVVVRQVGVKSWQLAEPLTYQGNQETFTVPVGFETDLASVPRPLVWLLPRYGLYTKSAILHDYLCCTGVERSDADGLFRRSMYELGVPFTRRWMMWAAVRLGSHLSGAGVGQIAVWLLVALPSLLFVLVPGLVVLGWLIAFWLIELLAYLALKPFSRKRVHRPNLLVKMG